MFKFNSENSKKKNNWEYPSYLLELIGLFLLLIPIIIYLNFNSLDWFLIFVITFYFIGLFFVISLIISSKNSIRKSFYDVDLKFIIKTIDSLLNNLNIPYQKKNRIRNQFFLKIYAEELYEVISNNKFYIKIIENSDDKNSTDILIEKISKSDHKIIRKIIKIIDKKVEKIAQ